MSRPTTTSANPCLTQPVDTNSYARCVLAQGLRRWSSKYAMHAMRIAHQGLELFDGGTISLPMQEPTRSQLRSVGAGAIPLPAVLAEIDELSDRLTHASKRNSLPSGPDDRRISAFLADAYPRAWASHSN